MSKKTNHSLSKPTLVYRKKIRYRYVPVRETLSSDELGTYDTYGISVRTTEEEISFVRDVSTEFEEIQYLTNVCTEKQLDPEHLSDVLEDFLAEGSLITS